MPTPSQIAKEKIDSFDDLWGNYNPREDGDTKGLDWYIKSHLTTSILAVLESCKEMLEKKKNSERTIECYDETNSRDEAMEKGSLTGYNTALSDLSTSLTNEIEIIKKMQ